MFEMDNKTRNLELEKWLIETASEEIIVNLLGPNWNRFDDELGYYPNIGMTMACEAWQHQQAKVEELQKRVDLAISGINGVMRWIDEDAIDDADFIRGGVLSALRRLEQALKGEGCQ